MLNLYEVRSGDCGYMVVAASIGGAADAFANKYPRLPIKSVTLHSERILIRKSDYEDCYP